MIQGLLARKLGMSQVFDKDGNMMPVTILKVGPCTVLETIDGPKTKVKVAFEPVKENKLSQPQNGYFKKLDVQPHRHVREILSLDNSDIEPGQEISADIFKPGDFVNVCGMSIGKGFQGGMKRWGWTGGPAGHGSMHHRRVGSIGASADPSNTVRGRHMPGQMGHVRITVKNLRVLEVIAEENLVLVKGGVPGSKNTLLQVTRSQTKAFRSLDEQKAIVKHKVNPMKQSKAKAGGKKKGK